jgi:hypothetical protein
MGDVGRRVDDAAAATPAAPGLVLDDRYRLDQVRSESALPGGTRTVLWRADDLSLGRKVAIRLVESADPATHERLATAAAQASHVGDGRFVRVLDVGSVRLPGGTATWLATEWVDAPSLAATVRDAPLPPEVATEVVRQCAEALAIAQAAGARHGVVHPDQVLLPPRGAPRVTGLETAAAVTDAVPADPGASARADTQALGGVLFAALTGRWPLPGWSGLPAADPKAARQGRPRLLRAGIDRELDEVTHRALTGGYPDCAALARALAQLPARALDAPLPEEPADRQRSWSVWAWRVVPPVVVVVIALIGWALGSDLGRVPGAALQHHPSLPKASGGGAGGHPTRVWHRPPDVTSFDPEGDGEENSDTAALAVDRDLTTAWDTARYRGDSHLGGLKSGVGLLVDLGRPKAVRVAELALTAAGSTVEIRAGNSAPAQARDLPLVAGRDRAPDDLRLELDHAVRARYWLIWFTNLPPSGDGGFSIGVAEVALLG